MHSTQIEQVSALRIGQTASLTSRFTAMDAELCTILSDDADSHFEPAGGSALWIGWMVSGVLEGLLPGAGALQQDQRLRVERPVRLGEAVTATVTVTGKRADGTAVAFDCTCTNQDDEIVASGTAEVIAPIGGTRPAAQMQAHRYDRHAALLAGCAGLPPLRTAIVHPCDEDTLQTAVAAAEAGLIDPVLIGPAATICSVAALCQLDLRPYHLIGVDHDHSAAETAVTLARVGKVEAIMQGSPDAEDLMTEVVEREAGPDLPALDLESGIVLGAEVPVILASRADTMRARLTCCAIASLLATSRRRPSLAAE
ncbi:enoyl-CoA hydratase [Azospirillum thermophilum]|uniref:Enoyl-CoA hydratase n=1 Tax=Azospirillum thermophilum TaxID=2202148 RepID=A0A2S2CY57_9PROT|nr:enoyl-CoA hydratase [Azospirillum thermophilum]AWK89454.1 enoyl-CoA hydratase [Azospirillum thermophilum]